MAKYNQDLSQEKPENTVGTTPRLSVASSGLSTVCATGSECSAILPKLLKGLVILTVLLSVTVFGCAPDFTQPGDRGGQTPTQSSINRGASYDASRLPPPQGACGQQYPAKAMASQAVTSCAGYNFAPLYNRAIAAADFTLIPISCPAECTPKHTWIESRFWHCVDFLFGLLYAIVVVEKKALCSRETDPRPAGLPPPTAADLQTAPHSEGGGSSSEFVISEHVDNEVAVQCRSTEIASFRYWENVQACQPLNYQPIVLRAGNLARQYYGSLECSTPLCAKQPYRPLNTAWGCRQRPNQTSFAYVDVYFAVECR